MSRETDTPSSGPNGRGGAAYPSGTPPYGTPMVSDNGTDAGRSAAQPEERKTETTLTTRIRINIPGSRPIPPVVMRTPVADAERSDDDTGTGKGAAAEQQLPSSPLPGSRTEPAPAEADAPAEERTSDWFAPRKGSAGKSGPGGGGTNGAGMPGASPAAQAGPAAPATPSAPAAPGQGTGLSRPGGVVGSMSMPGATRPGGTNGAGLTGATGGPVAPGHGGGTGSFDVTEALAAGPLASGTRPGTGGAEEPRRDDLPYFSESGRSGPSAPAAPNAPRTPQAPAGPTAGPVTGDSPLVPPMTGRPGPGMAPGESFTDPGAAPGNAPAGSPRGPRPAGALGDDTAILTPQKPAQESGMPGVPGYRAPADNVSGQTVTSGIPIVPPAGNSPFGPRTGADGPLQHTPPKLPEPVSPNVPESKKSAKPAKKKGRSKLVLLGVLLVVGGAGVYGAGLLMNHSDVPKGTTVLGVDIGGGTRDDAVKKLNDAFGARGSQPLKLSVDGRTVSLVPSRAGLQFDIAATVGEASGSDYNPVSVIGTLFGEQRVVEPVMPVDEEKLQAALKTAGGGSGSVTEGTIKFESGKAVAVYGKAGKGIDAAGSVRAVEQAYRSMVETGTATPVTVSTTGQQPTISRAEVDRKMKEFAEPAMSGLATVRVDAAHKIQFGPLSLPKILGVKAIDGKLVETYNLEALKKAYGRTFDGVKVESATGKRDVIPQDVVNALRTALRGRTKAERVGIIETNPN
ncbi:hypothetical protein [Streptomyces sp. NPDC086787]|uniref:hypothetical protein n=1 Tax=Streptomyces sp. NPDC086787 TaxID=3365759 RepID=UPI0038300EC6